MSVNKRKREILAIVDSLCPRSAILQDAAGKHLCLTISGPGGQRKVACSKTPSDYREIKNLKRKIVQAMRAVELLPPQQ